MVVQNTDSVTMPFGSGYTNGHGGPRTTGFIADPQFWADEHDSPLLSRNGGFCSLEKSDELCDRASQWLDKLPGAPRDRSRFW